MAPLDVGTVFAGPVTITATVSDDIGEPPVPVITLNGNAQPAVDAVTDAFVGTELWKVAPTTRR